MATTTISNEKSKLNYNFKKAGVSAVNKGRYLSIRPNDKSTISASYTSTDIGSCHNGGKGDYAVNEIRVFHPSLHTYNYQQATGELIISLNNIGGGRHLIICIAITTRNGTQPNAASQLATIINHIANIGNSTGEGGTIQGLNFDLNKFMPVGKPFYSYTATLPYQPCTSCTDYVVYDMKDASISLDPDTIGVLNTLIKAIATNIQPMTKKLGYAYTKKGATFGLLSAQEQIYISCNPTGINGQVLIDEDKNSVLNNNPLTMFIGNMNQKDYKKLKLTLMAIAIILGSAIFFTILINKGTDNVGKPKVQEVELGPITSTKYHPGYLKGNYVRK